MLFADLLSLHLVTFLIFFILVVIYVPVHGAICFKIVDIKSAVCASPNCDYINSIGHKIDSIYTMFNSIIHRGEKTVESLNKGHFGSRAFVLFSEVVLWWEVQANMQFIAPSRLNIPG